MAQEARSRSRATRIGPQTKLSSTIDLYYIVLYAIILYFIVFDFIRFFSILLYYNHLCLERQVFRMPIWKSRLKSGKPLNNSWIGDIVHLIMSSDVRGIKLAQNNLDSQYVDYDNDIMCVYIYIYIYI